MRSLRVGGVEDVVSVLTLVRRGVAQVCHVLRVQELQEQLEVGEEEEGKEDGQEEGEEVESGEYQREERTLTWMAMKMGVKGARLNLSQRCECDDQGLWNSACRLSACCDAPRDRRSAVCPRRHWCSHCCALCPACCCTRRSN